MFLRWTILAAMTLLIFTGTASAIDAPEFYRMTYIGQGWNSNTDRFGTDEAMRFGFGQQFEIFEPGQIFSRFGIFGRVYVDCTLNGKTESAAGDANYQPELGLSMRHGDNWRTEGLWGHNSNLSTEERSKDIDEAKLREAFGFDGVFLANDFSIIAQLDLNYIFHEGANSGDYGEIVGFDGAGEFGFDLEFQAQWGQHLFLAGSTSMVAYSATAGWNPTGGDNTWFFTGKVDWGQMLSLAEGSNYNTLYQLGIAVAPRE